MARFLLKAHDRRGQDVSLSYDNQTSELLDSDGSPWTLPYVDKSWSVGAIEAISQSSPGAKSSPAVLKIQLGLSCNYACDYCSQRFVPHAEETTKDESTWKINSNFSRTLKKLWLTAMAATKLASCSILILTL